MKPKRSTVLPTLAILSFAITAQAKADTYYLLINAAPPPAPPAPRKLKAPTEDDLFGNGSEEEAPKNLPEFYYDLQLGYRTLKSMKAPVTVLASDGKWRVDSLSTPPDIPVNGGFRSARDLQNALQTLTLRSGDNVVIYFSGHGKPLPQIRGTDENLMNQGMIETWGGGASVAQIDQALGSVPQGVSVKISGNLCGMETLQAIARKRENVCVASPVPYYLTFQPGDRGSAQEGPSLYDEGFWSNLGKNTPPSLASAAIGGFAKDDSNLHQGKLSSFDLVDYVLKKGPYEKPRDDANASSSATALPPDFRSATDPDAILLTEAIARPASSDDTPSCFLTSVETEERALKSEKEILRRLVENSLRSDLARHSANWPGAAKTVFQDAIDDLETNGAKYLELARNPTSREAALALGRFSWDQSILKRLAELDEFSKKATPEQSAKFLELLRCEWASLR